MEFTVVMILNMSHGGEENSHEIIKLQDCETTFRSWRDVDNTSGVESKWAMYLKADHVKNYKGFQFQGSGLLIKMSSHSCRRWYWKHW